MRPEPGDQGELSVAAVNRHQAERELESVGMQRTWEPLGTLNGDQEHWIGPSGNVRHPEKSAV